MAHGEIAELRVVGRSRTTFDDAAGFHRARRGEEHGDVSRHVQDAHRQRNRLATRDAWKAETVPALEDVLERRLGPGAQAEPPCEVLRDLTVHGEGLAGDRDAVGDDVLDQPRPFVIGKTAADMLPEEPDDRLDVARVDEGERRPRHDVVAVQLRLVPSEVHPDECRSATE